MKKRHKVLWWEIWTKQNPKSLYYYSIEAVRICKINYQNKGHTKVYIKGFKY